MPLHGEQWPFSYRQRYPLQNCELKEMDLALLAGPLELAGQLYQYDHARQSPKPELLPARWSQSTLDSSSLLVLSRDPQSIISPVKLCSLHLVRFPGTWDERIGSLTICLSSKTPLLLLVILADPLPYFWGACKTKRFHMADFLEHACMESFKQLSIHLHHMYT